MVQDDNLRIIARNARPKLITAGVVIIVSLVVLYNWTKGGGEDEFEDNEDPSWFRWRRSADNDDYDVQDNGDDNEVSKSEPIKIKKKLTRDFCEVRSRKGDWVTYKYNGKMLDSGKEFDSGEYTAILGAKDLIKGLDKGLRGMCKGEKRKITIHWSAAFGKKGDGERVPPKTDVVFDIRMVKVERST